MSSLVVFKSGNSFLRKIQESGVELAKLIPGDSPAEFVVETIRLCAQVDGEVRKFSANINLAIGRCLSLAAENPEIWKHAGYKSLKDFADCELSSVSHGTRWGLRKIVDVFKDIPVEHHVNGGGITNLVTAAYALPKDASQKQKREALERVKMPVAEYKVWIEKQYGMERGETDYGRVVAEGNQAQAQFVEAFFLNKQAQELTGSTTRMGMLVGLIDSLGIQIMPDVPGEEKIPEDHQAVAEPEDGWK